MTFKQIFTMTAGLLLSMTAATSVQAQVRKVAAMPATLCGPENRRYVVNDLGSLNPGDSPQFNFAYSLNAAGTVVGQSNVRLPGITVPAPFLWNAAMGMLRLPTLGATANKISDSGLIVGEVFFAPKRGLLWNGAGGGVIELQPAAPYTSSSAVSVNSNGTVVGISADPQLPSRATLWQNGQAINIGVFPGYRDTYSADINEAGDVLINAEIYRYGNYTAYSAFRRAANGQTTILPGIVELPTIETAFAAALNNRDSIVGKANRLGNYYPVWWRHGTVLEIGDGRPGVALDINDNEQIIGMYDDGSAFLHENGTNYDLSALLNDPTWTVVSVREINNRGQMAATLSRDLETHAVRLDPVCDF